jgi:hypothetical protein
MKKAILILAMLAGIAQAANEVSVNWTFKAEKGNVSINRAQTKQWSITNAAPNVSAYTVLVATNAAGTAIAQGSVTTNGWGWIINTSTNAGAFVDYGAQVSGTFYPVLRVYAGEGFPVRLSPGTTNYARAGTTSTNTPAAIVIECPIIDN